VLVEGSLAAGMLALGGSHLDGAIALDDGEGKVLAAATRDSKLVGKSILLSVVVQVYKTGA
jgi:hypothetical protein